MKPSISLIAVLVLSLAAFAAEAAPHKAGPGFNVPRPCKPLVAACEKAGFKPDGVKKGLGLLAHCMEPLIEGSSPKSAPKAAKGPPTVKQDDVVACQNAMRSGKRGPAPGGDPKKK